MAVSVTTLIRADSRRLRGDLTKAEKQFKSTFRGIGTSIKSSLTGALSPLGVGLGVTGLAIAGREVLNFEKDLALLAINAKKSNAWAQEFKGTVNDLSRETGMAREEILGAARALIDMEGASSFSVEKMKVLVKTSKTTGADMKTLAGIMFAINQQFFGGKASADELQTALGGIIEAGKEASVPLEEMQSVLRSLAPVFRMTGVSGQQAAADLAALIQVGAKGAFGSTAEIATGFDAMIRAMVKNHKAMKKFAGVDLFKKMGDGSVVLKDLRTIFNELAKSPAARDPRILAAAFGGRGEAMAFAQALLLNRTAFEDLSRAAMNAGNVIDKDYGQYMETPAARAEVAINNLKLAIAEKFDEETIKNIANAIEKIADALGWAADHMTEIAIAYGVIKMAQLVTGAVRFGQALSAAAAAAGGLGPAIAGAIGPAAILAAKIGLVAGAAVGGYAVGSWLDKKYKLSDRISESAMQGHYRKADIASMKFEGGGAALEAARSGTLTEKQRRRAGRVLSMAGSEGFLDATGTAPAVRQIEESLMKKGFSPMLAQQNAAQIAESIRQALAVREAEAERRMKVDVVVSVDQRGFIKVTQAQEQDARRQP